MVLARFPLRFGFARQGDVGHVHRGQEQVSSLKPREDHRDKGVMVTGEVCTD